jgi:hypothetical protein
MISAGKEFNVCNKVHILYTLGFNDDAKYSHCILLVMYEYKAMGGNDSSRRKLYLEKTYPSATTMFIKSCFWVLNVIN